MSFWSVIRDARLSLAIVSKTTSRPDYQIQQLQNRVFSNAVVPVISSVRVHLPDGQFCLLAQECELLQHRIGEIQKPVPVNLTQTVSATANVVARVPNDPRGVQRWHGCFRDGLFT